MMQDYPKILPPSANVGYTQAPAWLCYSPCKNNATDAAASIAQGVPAGAAWTAESDQYRCKAEMLRCIGARVDQAPDAIFLGIASPAGPRIVIDPSTALFFSELKAAFPTPSAVRMSARSTLILQGDVVVESLSLDGRLRVVAVPGTRILVRAGRASDRQIVNAGDSLVAIVSAGLGGQTCGFSEVDLMRGYVLQVEAEEVVTTLNTPGLTRLDESCGTWWDSQDTVPRGGIFVFTGKALVPLLEHDPCSDWADGVESCFG